MAETGETPGALSGIPRIANSSDRMRRLEQNPGKNEFQMKVILRDPSADLYVAGPNMWTDDRGKAFVFECMDHALELANQTGVKDLEVIVSFNHIPDDVHLPTAALGPSAGSARAAARL